MTSGHGFTLRRYQVDSWCLNVLRLYFLVKRQKYAVFENWNRITSLCLWHDTCMLAPVFN